VQCVCVCEAKNKNKRKREDQDSDESQGLARLMFENKNSFRKLKFSFENRKNFASPKS
jgi:hypothetical protein